MQKNIHIRIYNHCNNNHYTFFLVPDKQESAAGSAREDGQHSPHLQQQQQIEVGATVVHKKSFMRKKLSNIKYWQLFTAPPLQGQRHGRVAFPLSPIENHKIPKQIDRNVSYHAGSLKQEVALGQFLLQGVQKCDANSCLRS